MTQLMGILNLTPDSFSGDGVYAPEKALARIDEMIEEGASVIDIGAESTRPGAQMLTPQEEWQRLAPVAEALRGRTGKVEFSIDTRHAETARRALGAGFGWINDVSGGADPAMIGLAKISGARFAIMHSVSVPADPKRTLPPEPDAMSQILVWAKRLLEALERAGVERSRIVLDPGIGFGKTAEQSLVLIRDIARLKALGVPVMMGHSRKSFLSLFTDRKSADRDPETLAISYYLAAQQVDYLRVHDIKSHAAMLRIRRAL